MEMFWNLETTRNLLLLHHGEWCRHFGLHKDLLPYVGHSPKSPVCLSDYKDPQWYQALIAFFTCRTCLKIPRVTTNLKFFWEWSVNRLMFHEYAIKSQQYLLWLLPVGMNHSSITLALVIWHQYRTHLCGAQRQPRDRLNGPCMCG
jgi:hypothetical protein